VLFLLPMAKAASTSPQAQKHRGKARKEGIIAEFSDKVGRSKAMVFTNYQGLTHHQLEGLKRAAKKADADFVVTKNTLLLRSLKDVTLSDEDKKNFEQPTATLFAYSDVVLPLKNLAKTIKDLKLPIIKFGVLDGKVLSKDQVEKLATLPSLDVLRAQLLGQMKGPIQGLHRSLSWNLQKFVMTLKAIEAQKGN